jgi:dTDP-glucose pyrophosphorylase
MHGTITKAVITSAGMGTRMRPVTSIMPKALLPLYADDSGKIIMAPVVDMILDSLRHAAAKEFCIVVGQSGKLLHDYFNSNGFTFATQPVPLGFGDAVTKAREFVGNESFFLHADDGVLTGGYKEAAALHKDRKADIVLMLRKVPNASRYGVASVEEDGNFMGHTVYRITGVEEKPKEPKSNLALSAVYILPASIMSGIGRANQASPVPGKEVELTMGISDLIDRGARAFGLLLEPEKWLNVGDPESYFNALSYTHEHPYNARQI